LIAVDIVWATLRIDDWFWGSFGLDTKRPLSSRSGTVGFIIFDGFVAQTYL
ncbi:hypothetical protein HN272_19860, partial [Acinetobacter baumannii]|nr:hypothetical protein [Acinetobacter baumannii]